jgi:hypothetical protein
VQAVKESGGENINRRTAAKSKLINEENQCRSQRQRASIIEAII